MVVIGPVVFTEKSHEGVFWDAGNVLSGVYMGVYVGKLHPVVHLCT
jgi:hypothetical protein